MFYMPEYLMEDLSDNISDLPIKCILIFKDNSIYRRIYKISSAGLTEDSTVQDLLDDLDLWFEI